MPRLVVISEELPALAFELKLGVTRIGRSSKNDFRIDHPTVSAMHCLITWLNDAVIVRDGGSTNGTYIDGEKIKEAPLFPGHSLHVGEVELVLEITEVKINVPTLPVPEAPRPQRLPDGSLTCPNHPETPAVYRCASCKQLLCETCVHRMRRVGGKQLFLCPVCGQHCERLGPKKRKRPSFLEVLRKTLKMPFQSKPKSPEEE
jgi:hypothetical protein